MNEDLAIKIFKQTDLEVDVGGCKNCPKKDKNKTCIGCLDEAKDVLLNHVENLQNRIDRAFELLQILHYKFEDENSIHYEIKDIQKILKGGDE